MNKCIAILLAFFCFSALSAEGEYTLALIKPNAVKENHIGDIIQRFESKGLRVAGLKMQKLSRESAERFYAIHRERSFFNDLVAFMSSGPSVAIVLEGPDAVTHARAVMGETDPTRAGRGTIRADFGKTITENAVHGSDSVENAKKEIAFFFQPNEIH